MPFNDNDALYFLLHTKQTHTHCVYQCNHALYKLIFINFWLCWLLYICYSGPYSHSSSRLIMTLRRRSHFGFFKNKASSSVARTSLEVHPLLSRSILRTVTGAPFICSTLAVGNDSVRQSVGESLLRADGSSGQDQVEGSGQTDETRKTHGAPVDQGNP